METYTFRRSSLTMVFGAVFFTACGLVIWFLAEPGDGGRYARLLESIPFAREILTLLSFGFVALCAAALITQRPSLTANSQGFLHKSLFGKVTDVAWSDIQAFEISKHFLAVHYSGPKGEGVLNIGGMFKLKPEAMLDKMDMLSPEDLRGSN